MIPKKFDEIQKQDVEILIANRVAEGKTIEYKQELPNNSDSDKKEFLADVSSFANTTGGDLIYGVREDAGLPVEIIGVKIADADAETRRLDGMLQNGIDPRIQYAMRTTHLENNKHLVLIRVKQSWIKPHRVVFAGHDKFYARGSAGKYALDVSELRELFTLSETLSKRIQNFRMERLMEIESDNAPLPITGENKIILHLVPLESFSTKLNISAERLTKLYDDTKNLRPMLADGWFAPQINVTGVISHAGEKGRDSARSYVQLFRTGVIEAVESSILERDGTGYIPSYTFEEQLIKYTGNYLNALRSLEINPPIFVFISLTNVAGLIMSHDRFGRTDSHPIREKNLHLPEVIFENYDQPVHTTLKPILDLVWNACGIPQSLNFDKDGNWIKS